MRLADFDMVEALVSTRNHLIGQRDGGRPSIEISGRHQDPAMVEVVKPAITAELNRRIDDVDAQLARLGVEVD